MKKILLIVFVTAGFAGTAFSQKPPKPTDKEALLTVLFSRPYTPSFWLYHIELAAGYSVIRWLIRD